MRQRLARLRRANPGRRVEVWAEDEAPLGLKPVTRRVWCLRGRRPRSGGRTRFDWLYVYGFARPGTGQTFCVLLPRVNASRMADALAAFAAHADPAREKVLVVRVDNAGWPVAKRLVVPPNVALHVLPPCTPELQPVEPLWPLVRKAVANRSVGRIDRLRAILRTRLTYPVTGFADTSGTGRPDRRPVPLVSRRRCPSNRPVRRRPEPVPTSGGGGSRACGRG